MKKTVVRFLFITCAILGLYGISRWNFLFLHALVETAAIGISWVIATIVWNARARIQNQFILICGLSFAVVGALEMLHLYSVVGMNVFPVNTPDLEAQFWVSARLIQGSALLGGLMALRSGWRMTRTRTRLVQAALGIACVAAFATILIWPVIPSGSFQGGVEASFELVVVLLFALTLAGLWWNRTHFDPTVLRWLTGFFAGMMVCELVLLPTGAPTSDATLISLGFRFIAIFCLYRAVLVTVIENPEKILYLELVEKGSALQTARERLDLVLNNSREGSVLLDSQGRILLFNSVVSRTAQEIFQISLREGDRIDGIVPEKDRSEFWANFYLARQQMHAYQEIAVQDPVNGVRQFCIHFDPAQDGGGKMIGVVLSLDEITHRRQNELALIEFEQRLAEFQRINHSGVFTFDRTNGRTYWSEEAIALFGLKAGGFQHGFNEILRRVSPPGRIPFQRFVENLGKCGDEMQCDFTIQRPDGTSRRIRARARKQEDSPLAGLVLGVIQEMEEVPGKEPV